MHSQKGDDKVHAEVGYFGSIELTTDYILYSIKIIILEMQYTQNQPLHLFF